MNEEERKGLDDLARNLCAVYVADAMGIKSIAHARKMYASGKLPDHWYDLAVAMRAMRTEAINEMLS